LAGCESFLTFELCNGKLSKIRASVLEIIITKNANEAISRHRPVHAVEDEIRYCVGEIVMDLQMI
jgi:hypothetical protein